jgi:hypothetical protein
MEKKVMIVFKLIPEALHILDEQIKKEVVHHCTNTTFPWCAEVDSIKLIKR